MVIDQRNAGASVTPVGLDYTLDRWRYFASSQRITVQRNAGSVTPPTGFTNYLGVTSTGAYTPTGSDFFGIQQFIEGFNFADLAWGTSNASPVTLSFWVRSSLTGTFGGSLQNSPQNRSYPFSYTISSANTWEYKTITIAGDTTGTWLTDNGRGVAINLMLGVGTTHAGTAGAWTSSDHRSVSGSVNVVATNGATFYITGVQLEKGSTATSFDYRPYGTELALCQRYAIVFTSLNANDGLSGLGTAYATNNVIQYVPLPVTPRTNSPGISYSGSWRVADGVSATAVTNIVSGGTGINCAVINFTVSGGLTQFRPYYIYSDGTGARILVNMEL